MPKFVTRYNPWRLGNLPVGVRRLQVGREEILKFLMNYLTSDFPFLGNAL